MNKTSLKELKDANEALAQELVRTSAKHEKDLSELRANLSEVHVELRSEQDAVASLRSQLEKSEGLKADMEVMQLQRLKEIQKRFKSEHDGRIRAETELAKIREQKLSLEKEVNVFEIEQLRLREQLSESQSQVSCLSASVAADTAVIAELRGRVTAAESRLEGEQSARLEATGRLMASEAQLRSTKERAMELHTRVTESESKLQAVSARAALLDDERSALQASLAQERKALDKMRCDVDKVHQESAQLQAASALASALAASEKAETERTKRELSLALSRAEDRGTEVDALRASCLTQSAELAGLRAAHEASMSAEASLRDELRRCQELFKSELQAQEAAAAEKIREFQSSSEKHMDALEAQLHKCQALLEDKAKEAAVLQADVEKLRYQTEHNATIFQENESLQGRLSQAESGLRQKEALLAETLASHTSQLEMWRAEATEVAQAASKWKQRAMLLQAQVDARESDLAALSEQAASASNRASVAEQRGERLQAAVQDAESRALSTNAETQSLRQQLQAALSSQQLNVHSSESSLRDLALKEAQLNRVTLRLQEESEKAAKLRHQLAELTARNVKDLDKKSHLVTDLTVSLHSEERARAAAERQAAELRRDVQVLERGLRIAQAGVFNSSDIQLRNSDAYAAAAAALLQADEQSRAVSKADVQAAKESNGLHTSTMVDQLHVRRGMLQPPGETQAHNVGQSSRHKSLHNNNSDHISGSESVSGSETLRRLERLLQNE
ncbi:hypothetical protein CEUSTIGMA_g4296.t1 [Chlamydomonas eustigma]|uniref:Uncharacterized protein n=1 Tax=Chlamydomonas eustigma TaxID=1157962 RepID=A0A250X279_9CHLO|nr:hypothetical protein CEUSTIGMA_g4296.t1 [Chlamydomonas eustigma]|eukprot:GAX76850.1 hypothetical protein CEUSTIGMA_g4296.t1 [Chlamydomonas eustigma]